MQRLTFGTRLQEINLRAINDLGNEKALDEQCYSNSKGSHSSPWWPVALSKIQV